MPPESRRTLSERRDRALERIDAGHQALLQSLEGMDAEDAFLGSRWSVWEVLKHVDSPEFVDSLEHWVSGAIQTLPGFGGREERLKQDVARLEATFQRLRRLFAGLSEEQLAKPLTPPNPINHFPGLTMVQLVESVMGHEAAHARQIEATRKYVAEFSVKKRAVTFAGLGTGDPPPVSPEVKELVSYADYVAGSDQALNAVRPWVRGIEFVLEESNEEQVLSRMGRETRNGQWSLVVCLGDPRESCADLMELARRHCDSVVVKPD